MAFAFISVVTHTNKKHMAQPKVLTANTPTLHRMNSDTGYVWREKRRQEATGGMSLLVSEFSKICVEGGSMGNSPSRGCFRLPFLGCKFTAFRALTQLGDNMSDFSHRWDQHE